MQHVPYANNVRNATCAASKTSKVPTQDALLFISYSMRQTNLPEISNIKPKSALIVKLKNLIIITIELALLYFRN